MVENKELAKIYRMLGASNHIEGKREENDYYATSPIAMELILEKE